MIIGKWDKNKSVFQLIDLRSNNEYLKGHIPFSINIPFNEITLPNKLNKLDPGKKIIVCSNNGQLGQMVTTILNLLGYNAVNLLFGMMDWNLECVDQKYRWDANANFIIEKND